MAQDIQKQTLIDIDVYGRDSITGGALIHEDDFALSNGIIFFLTSSQGDYLYRPDLGGILEGMLFKQLTPEKASFYQSKISRAIDSQFGALLTDIDVTIETDFENRMFRIDIFFTSLQSGQTNQVPIAVRVDKLESLGKAYVPVEFIDDNLLAFVMVQQPVVPDPLIKNQNDNIWYWGTYKLINFNEDSDNFQEIFDLINN